MTPEQEEWLIRNLQQQQEQLQEMRQGFATQIADIRAEQQRSAERFEAQMAEMRAEQQRSAERFEA
ncbi:MAG: hypothetical protein Q6K85_01130, partial [Thermostichus sp. DG02_1_bins_55]